MLPRWQTFALRAIAARRLGLFFTGTTHFALPTSAILGGKRRNLSFPDDHALAHDVIEVWLDDEYGFSEVKGSVSTVLDIGANVGLFTLWAWRYFPTARIHSYEPNPAIRKNLTSNIQDLPNITIWAEGISDRAGRARLIPGTSSRLAHTTTDEAGEIPLIDLKTAVERLGGHIDLMKLDCEGGEWAIFRKAEAFATVREIRMEYHLTEGRSLSDLREAAKRLDFEITHLRENQGFGTAYLSNRQINARIATAREVP